MVTFTHNDAGTSEAAWAGSRAAGLPELPLDDAALAGRAFIVLAAHPDDESLGAGGLLARLHAVGATVRVLLCTAGEGSHPGSPTTTPEQLAAVRLQEFGDALEHLSGGGDLPGDLEWQCLGLPDGQLAGHLELIRAAVREAAGECGHAADEIVLVAPYRSDGHTDHDVLGSVAAELSAAAGYALLEYPIWYWLWAAPEGPDNAAGSDDAAGPDDPAGGAWRGWFRLPLRPAELAAKAAAMAAHTSQVLPLSGLPGDEVLLPPAFLAHFERSWETFAWHPADAPADAGSGVGSAAPAKDAPADAGSPRPYAAGDAERLFDAVHARDEDPWRYTSSWYEQRKRSLTLAALPGGSYTAGLEIGCSIGTLSAELAPRCGSFLAVDASGTALDRAARRLAHLPAATTHHLTVPNEWPDGSFDLIVVSEVGYYLSPAELAGLFDRIEGSLMPGGTLALCHWRHPVSGWELDGDSVHAAARRRLGWTGGGIYQERDFILEMFLAPDAAPDSAPQTASLTAPDNAPHTAPDRGAPGRRR
ncbi:bifunctional PIG-L family deacetylase/class I SAM-dependent methyltransferase [Arthrobacter sp. ES3-54]|uniref:bifunctional PIG-L family deacetylase/class I SAM-dependent methyltransferase n=1 Tax=Arthrobacter sp. ES3-54 TaxID=1502991 RepID=UPI0024069BCD|nr:bifunctional PIG-L family deacetylase/class I SAM-dependent methyltransferase [Arthrobacter sp. ES3-54]MDF9750182.1 LmbE family N-acetylglucosaminyl deacetylase/SAM-dependent methyltransferase [Arthrobacter sp. ES3-54]